MGPFDDRLVVFSLTVTQGQFDINGDEPLRSTRQVLRRPPFGQNQLRSKKVIRRIRHPSGNKPVAPNTVSSTHLTQHSLTTL